MPGTEQPVMRELERVILLRVVDENWMDHIDAMHELRRGIGIRAYGNVNPIDEYKRESFDMFEAMVNSIKDEVVRRLFTVELRKESTLERKSVAKGSVENVGGDAPAKKKPVKVKKIGRNDPCPCGSGKKYKHCCGRDA
jgi:preprotein translocase subunit SecA